MDNSNTITTLGIMQLSLTVTGFFVRLFAFSWGTMFLGIGFLLAALGISILVAIWVIDNPIYAYPRAWGVWIGSMLLNLLAFIYFLVPYMGVQ